MLISTKGRYAMRVMLDLSKRDSSEFIPLKEMAASQEISVKYLEGIITSLSRAGLVEGVRGKRGGYRLTRTPEEYTAEEIIIVADGSIAPVSCLKDPEYLCERESQCQMKPVYEHLYALISGYLRSLTLKSIIEGDLDRSFLTSEGNMTLEKTE